jgi:hypothetical protein
MCRCVLATTVSILLSVFSLRYRQVYFVQRFIDGLDKFK